MLPDVVDSDVNVEPIENEAVDSIDSVLSDNSTVVEVCIVSEIVLSAVSELKLSVEPLVVGWEGWVMVLPVDPGL